MRTAHLLAALGILAGGIATAPSAYADAAIIPIGPDQPFHGLVNNVHDGATIKMVCPGPAFPGQTGHPGAGQTIGVALGTTSAKEGGYTGSAANSIDAAFPAVSTGTPIVFKYYNVPQAIPTSAWLPCSGTADIWFVPAPTSDTAVPDKVTVTFVNMAV